MYSLNIIQCHILAICVHVAHVLYDTYIFLKLHFSLVSTSLGVQWTVVRIYTYKYINILQKRRGRGISVQA